MPLNPETRGPREWRAGAQVGLLAVGLCLLACRSDPLGRRRPQLDADRRAGEVGRLVPSPAMAHEGSAAVTNETSSGSAAAAAQLPVSRLPAVAPSPEPRLLACGAGWILQLTDTGYTVHQVPSLAAARYVAKEPLLGVQATMGDSAVLLGRHRLYRVYKGEAMPSVFDGYSLLGPTRLWPDAETLEAVFLQDAREPVLRRFSLVGTGTGYNWDSDARALGGFDLGAIEQLADGSWLYTTSAGLARIYGASRWDYVVPAPSSISHLVAVPGRGAFWLARSEGRVERFRLEPWARAFSAALDGVPLALVSDAARLAVVTARDAASQRSLTVFLGEEAGEPWTLPLLSDAPSLCLVPERPWVALGGRQELILYDYLAGQRVR